jgi:hypothetical protein
MTPIQSTINKSLEAYQNTKFAKGGGACFECCDYEGMDIELRDFLQSSQIELLKAVLEELEPQFIELMVRLDKAENPEDLTGQIERRSRLHWDQYKNRLLLETKQSLIQEAIDL